MLHPHIIYNGKYTIGTYDIDSQKRLTLPALTKMMHESAMQNVLRLKLSVWDLEEHNISWVLMRKRMEILRTPILGETIRIETNPAGFEKFFTYRDFKVYDEKDELIAWASSTWLLMDTVKRRMARIPDFIKAFEMPDIPFLERPINKFQDVTDADLTKDYTIGYFELDWNEHLNNTHYFLKMLETLPLKVVKDKSLSRMDMIYKNEGKYGENISSVMQEINENHFLHKIIFTDTGKELAQAQTFWK